MRHFANDMEVCNPRVRKAPWARAVCGISKALALLLVMVSTANAVTYTVTKTADTNDGVCNADCSLREAITVANATVGNHTVAFSVPPADPGFTAGVAVITLGSTLPPLTRANLTIDGATQTSNRGNTNPAVLGIGGTVGVDALVLPQVAGPEVEIRGDGTMSFGFRLQANNITIRSVAMIGFGTAVSDSAIIVDDTFTNALIENNVLGSSATAFADPAVALRNYGHVFSAGADNGTVRNNLLGFAEFRCVLLGTGSTGWTIQGNECRDGGVDTNNGDGFAIDAGTNNTMTGNLIVGASTQGLVDTGSSGTVLLNNTVSGNGVGSFAGAGFSTGIAIRPGTSNVSISRNIIRANYGSGLAVNNGAGAVRH